jgi:hypothetical protein
MRNNGITPRGLGSTWKFKVIYSLDAGVSWNFDILNTATSAERNNFARLYVSQQPLYLVCGDLIQRISAGRPTGKCLGGSVAKRQLRRLEMVYL